jgi:hypothetical protein
MKLKNVVLAAACAAALSAGAATAQAVFIDAQAVEVFQDHTEGVVNCRGSAQPSGNFYLPCGPGIAGTVRNREVGSLVTFSAPYSQFSGVAAIVVNANFNEDGDGPMWGTVELTLSGGGVVEGTYSGTANITDGTVDLKVVGNGSGGVAEGLQFRVTDVHDTPFYPVGNMQVRILNPGGKH